MVVRIRVCKSLSGTPFQFAKKALPTSGGDSSWPPSDAPWHRAHVLAYAASPVAACDTVYTLSQTVRPGKREEVARGSRCDGHSGAAATKPHTATNRRE